MTQDITNEGGHERPHEKIIIDGKEYTTGHGPLTGRHVLEISDRQPIDDYILFWLGPTHALEELAFDEAVHPHHGQIQEFFTFKSDRSFRFDLNGRREEWGAPIITEATLRKLAGAADDCRIYQEFHNQPERLLKPGERVDLAGEGVERFRVECPTTITVVNEDDGKEYTLLGFKGTKISTLIDEMYTQKLHLTRQNDDRLRCEGGGDVFQFASLTLGAYIQAGHCHCLVWLFAAGTGGAVCQ